VTVGPRASEANQGGGLQNVPDLKSAPGWMWVFERLSITIPVRDYLWLP
jgi:hypothetical protein